MISRYEDMRIGYGVASTNSIRCPVTKESQGNAISKELFQAVERVYWGKSILGQVGVQQGI